MGELNGTRDPNQVPPGRGIRRRVLLAEDNPALAQVTRYNLERAGYEVIACRDGQEAWRAVEQETFDALVSDEVMPGMTGRELCARMRTLEAHKQTPIILLTAKSLELDHSRLRSQLGVARVLGKPFSPRQLVETVGELLGPLAGAG